jgi:hypothetical protein
VNIDNIMVAVVMIVGVFFVAAMPALSSIEHKRAH